MKPEKNLLRMRIDLTRSFSTPSDGNEDAEDWLLYFRKSKSQYEWPTLHKHRVVVILGEAGIGKTLEFQNEVDRLQRNKQAAFFIPLNQVLDAASWALVISHLQPQLEHWEKSTDIGYFFLDAIDESRLTNHAAFERALRVISTALRPTLSRVRIAISSRITDWAVESVRDSVRTYLTGPIAEAIVANDPDTVEIVDGSGLRSNIVIQETPPDPVDAFVVSLDPLSLPEARKLADEFGVLDSANFWEAVEAGDYEHMATRPLDLGWMVNLWNRDRNLGTYLQLIDTNVSNRLTDVNPSYQQAGAVLSLDMLRNGAEQLAAATEFSVRPFIATIEGTAPNEIAPASMLSDWKPVDIARLLGSAVFDEATFGRVKFHHRSVRLDRLKKSRQHKSKNRIRVRERTQAQIQKLEIHSHDIEQIRDGSNTGTLHWLINYSYNQTDRQSSLPHVNFNTISRNFSSAIAEALASGLVKAWTKSAPLNPADYKHGQTPWKAITGLAGLHVLLKSQTAIAGLNDEDAARAAQLAVWELKGPPSWFEHLFRTHESVVLAT